MAYSTRRSQKGFTIVELMIAVSVFAVAMVMVMGGVIFISKQYRQATTRVALEEASRNVHQQVTQAMQFNGAGTAVDAAVGDYWATCIGHEMYIYGQNFSGVTIDASNIAGLYNNQKEGLYVGGIPAGGCSNAPADFATNGSFHNLLPPGVKVVEFKITGADHTGFSTVFVKAPSSDGGDLLEVDAVTNEIRCDVSLAGKEFCSVVKLNSRAVGRII